MPKSSKRAPLAGAALALVTSCISNPSPVGSRLDRPVGAEPVAVHAPPATPLPTTDHQKRVDGLLEEFFRRTASRRTYIQTDKPLYQPGETIWFRATAFHTSSLQPAAGWSVVRLVSPRGATVLEKRIQSPKGVTIGELDVPAEAEGGEYKLLVQGHDGKSEERAVIIASYEAPRLKKVLEFVKKAYGPGDNVVAAVEVKRATGEALANKTLTGLVTLDGADVGRVPVTTDAQGKATVKFALPSRIELGDGLLTILVDDGGVTESIQRRIPILLKKVVVDLFPEGGDLVAGVPGRVYFSARNTLGKPADIEGRVVDNLGREASTFRSLKDGMGRFSFTPAAGLKYKLEVKKPAGITQTFELPAAKDKGCGLLGIDDFAGAKDKVQAIVRCTEERTILVEGVLREKRVASASYTIPANTPQLVELPIDPSQQGVLRLTVLEGEIPLAERLIYRGRGRDLHVEISADKKRYSPRDPVTLTVRATDLAGKPVKANLGLAVVDDTVLSFADDKSAHLIAQLYLGAELKDCKLEEPNFFFSDKPEAAAGLDLVMGTCGFRRFEWQPVFSPPPPVQVTGSPVFEGEGAVDMFMGGDPKQWKRKLPPAPMPAPVPAAQPAAPMGMARNAQGPGPAAGKKELQAGQPVVERAPRLVIQRRDKVKLAAEADMAWQERRARVGWAVARVFPAPRYTPGYDGPRDDFRETIHWEPNVETGDDGIAKVSFYLSDAVTSFRATAEGSSAGGLPGRGEAVIQSKLPLALDARLPLEVSAGDKIHLPVSLANETDATISADLNATFGPGLKLGANPVRGKVTLAAGEKKTFFYPLEVTALKPDADSEVSIVVTTAGLKDEIKKKVRVVPLGFPFEVSASGTAKGGTTAVHELDLTGALPGTLAATVTMYPSPLSSMTSGAEALIREPGGCFEQTSSSNYPNVMALSYLESNDGAEPALVQRTQRMLDRGYKILTGYETKTRGYEWFGGSPGHEALTAYGVMEFVDMAKVYDAVDREMIDRTSAWLMSRRDRKGGFERNARALDSFGRAGYETTNGYIMWALAEAGRVKGMDKELEVQRKTGLESKDPYLVALAANTMLNTAPSAPETRRIVERLAGMQAKDGSFSGAKETITLSGGEALVIETTSLSALAMTKASKDGAHEAQLRGAVEWLNKHRGGWGEWGSTQGTILSLKALTAYAEHSRQTQAAGTATLVVNGREVGELHFDKGRREALVWEDVAPALIAGKNKVELRLDSDRRASLPYSIAIQYRAQRPQSSPRAKVAVATSINKKKVALGEPIRVHATVENKTAEGVPMTLARVGIPGGATFQTWQLKELRDKGLIDFYETRQREVILYFRALAPSARKEIDLDLLATVPGRYTAPATSAYLYYTNEDKSWVAPLDLEVTSK